MQTQRLSCRSVLSRMFLAVWLAGATGVARGGGAPEPSGPALTESERAALDAISADSLRGHLSFLASDLLEGRDTPSRGLDLAAEYIAAQFRRAGLEPAGDPGYFQVARWRVEQPPADDFVLEFHIGTRVVRVPPDRVTFDRRRGHWRRLDARGVRVVGVNPQDRAAVEALAPADVRGAVVVIGSPPPDNRPADDPHAASRYARERVLALGPALVIWIDRDSEEGAGLPTGRLIDPEQRGRAPGFTLSLPSPPELTVHGAGLADRLAGALQGGDPVTATAHLPDPVERPVRIRNVIGVLRGSDPALRDTFVMVTAHYDHVGIGAPSQGDRIYNGANDDGSGTVSVIELAGALAKVEPRPKRSIIFLTFFGEEHGLLGSRYYARHPVFPLDKTVADVNLEQLGRTDDRDGPRLNAASMTGFDYSDLGAIFATAGRAEGVRVFKHPSYSDPFFRASDNQALADAGVPAHTLCVAFLYPDYHAAGDHWEKVDFANMAKVDRMIARGLLAVANNPAPPHWNGSNPKAAPFAAAWKRRHPQ